MLYTVCKTLRLSVFNKELFEVPINRQSTKSNPCIYHPLWMKVNEDKLRKYLHVLPAMLTQE